MSSHRAYARIEAGQPWYSLGLLFLALGVLANMAAPAFWIGVFDIRDFGIGFLVGIGFTMLLASLWKQRRARRMGRG